MNYYYHSNIQQFIKSSTNEIIGAINRANQFDITQLQNASWEIQIGILKRELAGLNGDIFFEFSIPRMGKRIDTLLIIKNVVFVLEFKVGEHGFFNSDVEQVWDYALDLKNFHKPSHSAAIVPILISTEAKYSYTQIEFTSHNDNLTRPIKINKHNIRIVINECLDVFPNAKEVNDFAVGVYCPTPTIIEAALSLYNNHSVENITRSDADAKNLTVTTDKISQIIEYAKSSNRKAICFITGVPGAGKTLVGLKVATSHLDEEKNAASVYLSGNGPLVAILQEALARDKVIQERNKGVKMSKSLAKQEVKSFIQIIHHYRDNYLTDKTPPYDHVAIFDEAQRAWNKEQTVKFMRQKKNQADFDSSEPEFLISCLDRHKDWAVIVCLVGGGQEINTGEAGISEWLEAINNKYPYWEVYISPNLTDSEYAAEATITKLSQNVVVNFDTDLHLAVSMRSFRAENLSLFVKCLLDLNHGEATRVYNLISDKYPIVLTRDVVRAKQWLKEKARGSERYGMIVSSQALRLKPFAIDVKSPMNPIHWFLEDKDDIRSSYFLEDVATEFHVQGLELDWTCVTWDGDLRYSTDGWKTYSFVGKKWQNINSLARKKYLINAYRVLLTRARQGMVIVVPQGDDSDHTRKKEYYNPTYQFLKSLGIREI